MQAVKGGASSEWAPASAAPHDHRLIWMAQSSSVVSRFASADETPHDHELSRPGKDHGRGQARTATQKRCRLLYLSSHLSFSPKVYVQRNPVLSALLAMATRSTRLLLDKSRRATAARAAEISRW